MSVKKKMKKKNKILLLYIILGICVTAFLVFGGWLGYELYMDWQSQKYYTTLSSGVETTPREPGYSKPAPSTPSTGEEIPDEEPDEEEFVWTPYVDFAALSERYPGIVGWIKLEGTVLDYPIMQTDNNYFFLSHLPDGTKHRSGSVFLDYRNSPDFSDRDSCIYAHWSRTDDMFGILKNYRNQAFFEENPIIHIYTPEGDFELVLFAGYLVDSGVEQPTLKFRDDEHFLSYVADKKRRSFFKADVEVTADDRIVSLCTCAYDYTNARFIVVGKLVEF